MSYYYTKLLIIKFDSLNLSFFEHQIIDELLLKLVKCLIANIKQC